jgi:formylglycine-generating enzyme required for sulfatase activity
MRIQLKDSKSFYTKEVDFNSRQAEFSGFVPGAIQLSVECLSYDGKVLLRGTKQDRIDPGYKKSVSVPVEQLVPLTDFKPESREFTNSLGMKFLRLNPGSFQMGPAVDEVGRQQGEFQHEVKLEQGFYLQSTEVTQEQWEAVMSQNPSRYKDQSNLPVDSVNWSDVLEFIQKLNKRGEGLYRLPTEEEWEYAARAGSTAAYACGESESCLAEMAWYNRNADSQTHPVGQKKPNAWGLYDLHGNVAEWVSNWYRADGQPTDSADPQLEASVTYGLRGGSRSDSAFELRSAARHDYSENPGFRLVFRP